MIEVNSPISSWASSASAVADWTVAPCREHALDRSDERLFLDALLRRDGDRVELPFAVEQLLRLGNREHRERRRPDAVDAAVLGHADELEGALRHERRDLHHVAEREVLPVDGTGVDDDLAGLRRPAAFLEVQRVEPFVLVTRVDPEPEARRAARADGVAVGLEDLRARLVVDGAGRELDLRDGSDRLEQRLLDRRSGRRLAFEADVRALRPGRRRPFPRTTP